MKFDDSQNEQRVSAASSQSQGQSQGHGKGMGDEESIQCSSQTSNQSTTGHHTENMLQGQANVSNQQPQTALTGNIGAQGNYFHPNMVMNQQHNLHPPGPSHHVQHYHPTSVQQHEHHMIENQHNIHPRAPQFSHPQQQMSHHGTHFNAHVQVQHQHGHHQAQYNLPYNNFIGVGGGNPFENHHRYNNYQVPNLPASHSMNHLQQQCFIPHGHGQAPCLPTYQQHTFATRNAGVGWVGQGGNPNVPMSNNCTSNLKACFTVGGNPPPLPAIRPAIQPPPLRRVQQMQIPITEHQSHDGVPGGLEILWRELHPECQKLMTPQDIPESAKHRGYFTVCELLILKRALEARLGSGGPKAISGSTSSALVAAIAGGICDSSLRMEEEEPTRGQKRRYIKNKEAAKGNTGKPNKRQKAGDNKKRSPQNQLEGIGCQPGVSEPEKEQERQRNDSSDEILGELMIDLGSNNGENDKDSVPPSVPEAEVSGAVKAAMETLSSNYEPHENQNQVGSNGGSSTGCKNRLMDEVSAAQQHYENEGVGHGSQTYGEDRTDSQAQQVATNFGNVGEHSQQKNSGLAYSESQQSQVLPSIMGLLPGAISSHHQGDAGNDASGESQAQTMAKAQADHNSYTYHQERTTSYFDSRFVGTAPPPYRTLTLVLRMLQIGPHQIRSFSLNEPNKLRVIFNTQRLKYECSLPVLRPNEEDLNVPVASMRKILTIDIGFDQISFMEFKGDTLRMRVIGPPLLTAATCTSDDENSITQLTREEQSMMEQIENGELRLNPIHQVSFINERLAKLLEMQFREHSKFRHLFN